MMVQPDVLLVAGKVETRVLQRTVLEEKLRADRAERLLSEHRECKRLQPPRPAGHDIRVEHDDDGTAGIACACIACTGIATIAVHHHELHRKPMQQVKAAEQVLSLVVDFRGIQHIDDLGIGGDKGVGGEA
ncbi:hypothetical protein D9M68_420400 [compost metagenome]